MAEDKKGLNQLVQNIKDVNQIKRGQNVTIKIPSGKNPKDEVEYTMMDLISGICGAALFGESNRKKDNIQNLFSNPDKTYLGRLLKHIESVSDDKDNPSSLNVSISSITSGAVTTLVKSVNDFLKTQNSNNNGIANIILEINSKTDSIDKLNTFIQNLNQFGQADKNLNAITILSDVIDTINNIDKINTDGQNTIKTIYDNLCGGDEKLSKIIQSIVKLTSDSKGINIDGFGEFIKGVVSILSFDKEEINTRALYELNRMLVKGGIVSQIIENVYALSSTDNERKFNNAIDSISNYFEAILQLSDIGFMGRLRMYLNLKFFKNYVLKELPSLFSDIQSTFTDTVMQDNSDIIDNIKNYFNLLSTIGDISAKERMNAYQSIKFLNKNIIDELGKVISNISKLNIDNTNINNLQIVINTLQDLLSTKIEQNEVIELRQGLKEIKDAIFGNNKVIDWYTSEGSLLGILKGINDNSDIFLNTGKQFTNLQSATNKLLNLINKISNVKKIKLSTLKSNIEEIGKYLMMPLIELSKINSYDIRSGLYNLSQVIDNYKVFNKINNLHVESQKLLDTIKSFNIFSNEFIPAFLALETLLEKNNDKEILEKTIDKLNLLNTEFKKIKIQDFFDLLVVNNDTVKKLDSTIESFNKLEDINNSLISGSNKLTEASIKSLKTSLEQIIDIISGFNQIDSKTIENANKVLDKIQKFMVFSTTMLLVGALVMALVPTKGLIKYAAGITMMILLIDSILIILAKPEFKDVDQKTKLITNIGFLITGLSLVVALAAKVGNDIELQNLLKFGIGILALLTTTLIITFLLGRTKKKIDSSLEGAKDLSLLIIACGLSLGIATFMGKSANPKVILAFGTALSLLIGTITLVIGRFMKNESVVMEGVKELGIMILACAASLALAPLIVQMVPMKIVGEFTLLLGALVSGILYVVSKAGPAQIQGVDQIGTLVLKATAAVLLGGLVFMLVPDIQWYVVKFALILTIMVSTIIGVAGRASRGAKDAVNIFESLHKVILWSTVCLLLGGLLFMGPDGQKLALGVLEYGVLLTAFIAGVSLAIGLALKLMKDTQDAKIILGELIGLILTTGIIMLIAAHIMKDSDPKGILAFSGASLILVGGLAAIVWGITKLDQDKVQSAVLTVAVLSILTLVLAKAFSNINKALSENPTEPKLIWLFVAQSLILVGGLAAITALLSLIKQEKMMNALLAIGVISLVTIVLADVFNYINKVYSTGGGDQKAIWNFVGQALVLVGGIAAITWLLSTIDREKLNGGLIAIGVISLITLVLGGVFGLLNSILSKNVVKPKLIWNFVAQSLVLIGGIAAIIWLLGKIDKAKLIMGLVAISIATLITLGLAYVMKIIVTQVLKYKGVIGDIWLVVLTMLGTVALILLASAAIGAIVVGTGGVAAGFIIIGMVAIALAGLILWGLAELMGRIADITSKFDGNKLANSVELLFAGLQKIIDCILGLRFGGSNNNGEKKSSGGGILGAINDWVSKNLHVNGIGGILQEFGGAVMVFGKLMILGLLGLALSSAATSLTLIAKLKTPSFGKITLFFKDIQELVNQINGLQFEKDKEKSWTDNIPIIGTAKNLMNKVVDAASFMGKIGMITALSGALSLVSMAFVTLGENLEKIPTNIKENSTTLFETIQLIVNKINETHFGEDTGLTEVPIVGKLADQIVGAGTFMGKLALISATVLAISGVANLLIELDEQVQKVPKDLPQKSKVIFNCLQAYVTDINNMRFGEDTGLTKIPIVGKLADQVVGADTFMGKLSMMKAVAETLINIGQNLSELNEMVSDIPKDLPTKTKIIFDTLQECINQINKLDFGKTGISELPIGNTIVGKLLDKAVKTGSILGKLGMASVMMIALNGLVLNMVLFGKMVTSLPSNIAQSTGLLFGMIKSILKQLNSIKFEDETQKVNQKLIYTLDQYVKLFKKINQFDEELPNKIDILKNGINDIYHITDNIDDNEQFEKHTNTLKNYVEAINSVQIFKIKSMTNLANAMIKLSDRVGNLDKFTNTLANKVSDTLNKLASEIHKSEKVINKADALHEKRAKAIKDNMSNIQKLMAQEMTVKIKKDEEELITPFGNLGGGTNPDQDSSNNNNYSPTTNYNNDQGSNNIINDDQQNKSKSQKDRQKNNNQMNNNQQNNQKEIIRNYNTGGSHQLTVQEISQAILDALTKYKASI